MATVEVSIALPSFDYAERLKAQMNSVLLNAGEHLAKCIRTHMRMLAQTRHGSSAALGAKPSNHFKATDVLEPKVGSDSSVEVAVTTPGISRAYHDIDIYPKEANALAIPLHASAYGISPREINDRGTYQLFRIKRNGTPGNVLYRNEDGELIPMYALTKHVHQVQDPSLMPSNQQMIDAALKGAQEALKTILK